MALAVGMVEVLLKSDGSDTTLLRIRYSLCASEPEYVNLPGRPYFAPEPIREAGDAAETMNTAVAVAFAAFKAGTANWPDFLATCKAVFERRHGIGET